jgi:hypothetical protein
VAAPDSSRGTPIDPTGEKDFVLGLKTSALATSSVPLCPPATRTRPSGSAAVAGAYRPSAIVPRPPGLNVFVFGSKISAVFR